MSATLPRNDGRPEGDRHTPSVVDDPLAIAAGLEAVTRAKAQERRAKQRRKKITATFSVLTVLALGGFGALAWYGLDAARNVVGGTEAEVITDPSAPGFLAVVDETRVSLVALTDAEGQLDSLLMFPEPTDDGSAAVVWTLGDLLVPVEAGSEEETSLRSVFAEGGIDALGTAFADVVGFKMTDAVVASTADLEAITSILGTITVDNLDTVTVQGTSGGRQVRFERGKLELDAAEVVEYVTVRGIGEAPEDRGLRIKSVLTRLGEGLAALVDEDAPEEDPRDLGGFVIRWASADAEFVSLPLEPLEFEGSFLYRPNALSIYSEVAPLVPFPASAYPGQRPRARILNGTTDVDAARNLARDVAAIGTEVTSIGNAAAFDVQQTTVVYSDEAFAEVAERVASMLGTQASHSEAVSDATDIDIVLGADHTG